MIIWLPPIQARKRRIPVNWSITINIRLLLNFIFFSSLSQWYTYIQCIVICRYTYLCDILMWLVSSQFVSQVFFIYFSKFVRTFFSKFEKTCPLLLTVMPTFIIISSVNLSNTWYVFSYFIMNNTQRFFPTLPSNLVRS